MSSVLSKVYHTARTEGVRSLADRTARFLAYKYKRWRADNAPVIADWEALKDSYEGRRAFLIGNGPSLNRTPLYLLGEEHTMAFNRFDLMLERLDWTPDFYAVSDDRVLGDTIEIANAMAQKVDHAFFPDIHPYNVDFRARIVNRANVHWLFLESTRFSDRLPWCGLNKTVANVGLQILGYLGFNEIYLVGVDMDYSIPEGSELENARDITATEDNDQNHFDPRYFGKGRKYHVPMLKETFLKFREARQVFEARGVSIVNATRGGKLEAFPRARLEDVLGVEPDAIRRKFVSNVQSSLMHHRAFDVEGALALPPTPPGAELAPGTEVFRTPVDSAQVWINQRIHDFIPFGPFDGSYVFVAREGSTGSGSGHSVLTK